MKAFIVLAGKSKESALDSNFNEHLSNANLPKSSDAFDHFRDDLFSKGILLAAYDVKLDRLDSRTLDELIHYRSVSKCETIIIGLIMFTIFTRYNITMVI